MNYCLQFNVSDKQGHELAALKQENPNYFHDMIAAPDLQTGDMQLLQGRLNQTLDRLGFRAKELEDEDNDSSEAPMHAQT